MKVYCSLKQHGKHRISSVILCQCGSAAFCVVHPVHTVSTHQHNLPGGWVIWKEEEIPVFVFQSRKGNEYLILWLWGSVASNRICSFVSGLQNLLSGGLAGCASRNTENVSDAEEGDLRLFQFANRNEVSPAQGSIQAAACFVSHDLEPPYLFPLITGQQWSAC